jgi:lipase chaperone LimK
MARSAGAATTLLECLHYLYDMGADLDVEPGQILDQLESIGVRGFTAEQEPFFAMLGTVVRLLLRHADAEPGVMFAAAAHDLDELGRDLDQAAFDEIIEGLDLP